MKRLNLLKVFVVAFILTAGLIGFLFIQKSEMQTLKPVETPAKVIDIKKEIAGFNKWTKVNEEPYIMWSNVSALCRAPLKSDYEMDKSIHKNKYVNIYVNSLGKDEMLTKKNPVFAVGTVIVKEKLPTRDSLSPELLTVMIKREKGFNPEVGDWEFATVNGDVTEVTSQGKLENCQACHIGYKQNDFITRVYLTETIRQKLQ
jgi:hypothetical protein